MHDVSRVEKRVSLGTRQSVRMNGYVESVTSLASNAHPVRINGCYR
jgi:hypothetical protein